MQAVRGYRRRPQEPIRGSGIYGLSRLRVEDLYIPTLLFIHPWLLKSPRLV